MRNRRRFLSLCAGTTAFLAGCFGGVDDDTPEPGGASGTLGVSDTSPVSSARDGLLYQNEWSGATIEKGDGEIFEMGEISEGGKLSYSVNAGRPVGFDVYVFGQRSTKQEYERWINGAPSQPSGVVGRSGATTRNVIGEARKQGVLIESGEWWLAVDYSEFNGGTPRAEPGTDSPEEITVDVSIQVAETGF